jgi:hypothetical protein
MRKSRFFAIFNQLYHKCIGKKTTKFVEFINMEYKIYQKKISK